MDFPCAAILFDLDGTLIDSIAAVDRAWTSWSERHGLNPTEILPQIHGRRSIDSIRSIVPHLDAESEDAWLRHIESTDTRGVVAIAGSLTFLRSLTLPWGVVTSGTSEVARARMAAVGISEPKVAVFGEDVVKGKPAPDPFLIAAARLGIAPEFCLVFEDTAAGARGAKDAGMRVIGIGDQDVPFADATVPNFGNVKLVRSLCGHSVAIP